jgi:hypothetical protein
MLRPAHSSVRRKASSGTVIVPGNRMCPLGGLSDPSGT